MSTETTAKNFLLSLLVFLSVSIDQCQNAKVLFWAMHSSKSHLASMLPLAKELMKAGHDVHFLETSSQKNSFQFPQGITNHFMHIPTRVPKDLSEMWKGFSEPEVLVELFSIGDEAVHSVMKNDSEQIKKVMSTEWDVVFSDDLFAMGGFGMALRNSRINRKPYIMYSTTIMLQLYGWEQALSRVFTSRPALYSLREDNLDYDVTNCFHRLLAVFAETLAAVRVKYNIEHRNNKGLAMLGIQDFTFTNLWQNHAFNFVEEIDYLTFPSPMSTDVVYIGSHCPIAKRLPDDLREFTEDASSKGTIYIAFGTAVQWHSAPEYVTNAFRYMIENLRDYRILFVYNGNSFGELPEHVKVLKWAPQFDVLSHNKTILFISHGGLKSVKEAICTSTPVVYLPLFAEQTHNTAMAIKLGFARSLNKMTVTGEKMLSVVRDLLDNNTRYQRAVQRVHDLFLDRPMDSHSEAVFWTNRAVKLHGERNPTFKRRGMFLSLNAHFYLIHLLLIAVTILIASKS